MHPQKEDMPFVVAIVGPTASGKSDFAVTLAKKIDGEIISADSRQIYKGLDIATGKITKKEMAGIPHHLLDIVSPKKNFSVAEFTKLGQEKIADIITRGKIPIICGGTGFYIDNLLGDMHTPDVPPNKILRKKLESLSTEELFSKLKKKNSTRAKTIDSKNRVRLIRALEIVAAIGKVPTKKKNTFPYPVYKFGLDFPDNILKERITKRVISRIKKGMVKEAQTLHKNGLSFTRMRELGLEYRALADHLQNKIPKKELIERITKEDWQYAKRQRTWFKRDKNIVWLTH